MARSYRKAEHVEAGLGVGRREGGIIPGAPDLGRAICGRLLRAALPGSPFFSPRERSAPCCLALRSQHAPSLPVSFGGRVSQSAAPVPDHVQDSNAQLHQTPSLPPSQRSALGEIELHIPPPLYRVPETTAALYPAGCRQHGTQDARSPTSAFGDLAARVVRGCREFSSGLLVPIVEMRASQHHGSLRACREP